MARSHLIDTRVALLIQSVRFANIDKVATHSRPLDTGVWDNRRERRSPLLGKGGVAAPSSKWVPFLWRRGRGGSFNYR